MQQFAQFLATTGRRVRTLGIGSAIPPQGKAWPEARDQDPVLRRGRSLLRDQLEPTSIRHAPARHDGSFSSRHRCARPITAFPLLSEQIEKQLDGFLFPSEMMDHHLSLASDAAPFPEQAHIAKEVRFDRHGVIACHVPGGVRALDVEMVGLRDHERRIADLWNPV